MQTLGPRPTGERSVPQLSVLLRPALPPSPLPACAPSGLAGSSRLLFLLPRGCLSESELAHLNLTPQPCKPLQR